MELISKTHYDYLDIIGTTHAISRTFREQRWNKYFFRTYQRMVHDMLRHESRESIIDIGTSHGNWYNFFMSHGFKNIFGVELEAARAQQARAAGYTEVFNCDASAIPLANNSVDIAVSNDVFVHILQLRDKAGVLQEVQRILKPSGCFIVNHTMARAFRTPPYHIKGYCSYLSLDRFIRLVHDHTDFTIEDIKPTYFSELRHQSRHFSRKILRRLIVLPGSIPFLMAWDYYTARHKPLELSDVVYLKLRRPVTGNEQV